MKCPICGENSKNKAKLLDHMERVHVDDIPEGWSANRYYYYLTHGGNDTGSCMMCGVEVPYDEAIGRPRKLCGSEKCKKAFSEMTKKRTEKKAGKDADAYESDRQRKALAARKISGRYVWSDKTEKTYTGQMEKRCLWALDNIAELPSFEVFSPCPFDIYYKDEEGKTRLYIPDLYIISLNAVIEVKEDRKNNPNTHPSFKIDRIREALKDKRVKELDEFHYFKYTGDDEDLMEFINDIRLKNSGNSRKDKNTFIYRLNEAVQETSTAEENLYVGLIHPKGMRHIVSDIVFSYTASFRQLYYFDMEEEEVVTSSIGHKKFKGMEISISKYVGEDKSLPTKFFKEINSFDIDDKEQVPDQYVFFGKIINMLSPNIISGAGIKPDSFQKGSFSFMSHIDNMNKLEDFTERLIESYDYLQVLIESVQEGSLTLREMAGDELDRVTSMNPMMPETAKCFLNETTGEIIVASSEQAVNIGKGSQDRSNLIILNNK